ncbi:hypothetical protein [Sphingobium sp. B2]|uniref:hypothetical protein n=1 Tax=Sphingobium sp. B2 TaxID=2583228 RepID=UPI001643EFB0|nr:hypothetical protein [Sphingobium sp. B2]
MYKRQVVEQEAADELVGTKRCLLYTSKMCIRDRSWSRKRRMNSSAPSAVSYTHLRCV